jgi:hypothetical protein
VSGVSEYRRRLLGVGVVVAAVLLTYGYTVTYGLVWDDYVALRPRTLDAVLAAWYGHWDENGVWPAFYRPLSLSAYAGAYALFGHNTLALHVVNLIGLAIAAGMTSVFVQRETGSCGLGTVAAVLLVVHPETASSLAAWISQQFHLLALMAVIGTLLAWQRVRSRGAQAWLWILLPLSAGVLLKEDVVMLAPALIALQMIRARVVGDVPRISGRQVALIGGWVAVFLLARTAALRAIGGYGTPPFGAALVNLARGPIHAFAIQWVPSAHVIGGLAGLAALALVAAAAQRWRPAPPAFSALALYGLALGVCVNLPLALISSHTRVHLMILSAVLLWAGALGICFATIVRLDGRRRAIAALCGWILLLSLASRQHAATFAPCAPETLETDRDVLTWDAVSPEIRRGIGEKIARCTASPR